jgi:hypothetical protein
LRIGQDHDLPGIRGVGEDFLISRESGIKDNFAASLGGRTKTPALEDVPVLQGEYCIGQLGFSSQGVDNLHFSRYRHGPHKPAPCRPATVELT